MKKADVANAFMVYPTGHVLDERATSLFYEGRDGTFNRCFSVLKPCKVLYIDLNGDQYDEMVLFVGSSADSVYVKKAKKWQKAGYLQASKFFPNWKNKTLNMQDSEVVDSPWKRLRVGDRFFDVR